MAFDHVGVFTYSPEPGTKAVTLDLPPVPAEIAEERRNADHGSAAGDLLAQEPGVGRSLRSQVLIEAVGEAEDELGGREPVAVGRARRHAPEVDGMVFVPGALPPRCELMELEIAAAGPYDSVDPSGGGGGSPGSSLPPAARLGEDGVDPFQQLALER